MIRAMPKRKRFFSIDVFPKGRIVIPKIFNDFKENDDLDYLDQSYDDIDDLDKS